MGSEMGRRIGHAGLVALLFSCGCAGNEQPRTASDATRESHGRDVRGAADNTPDENKALARAMICESYSKWNTEAQIQCLDRLWMKESHWNHRAVNKRTGACGIPQSYPCDKMKKMGDRYGVSHRRNPWPQIAWGLRYIDERYGSPCAAWKRFRRGGGY